MSDREFSLAVVGIGYANSDKAKTNRRSEVAWCTPGEPVELRREPRNKHDKRAVAVFSSRGIQIGYLRAEQAQWIGGKILAGELYEVVFQEARPEIAVIRIRFGGGSPTLPPPRPQPTPPPDDDFYPDPDGPDWGA